MHLAIIGGDRRMIYTAAAFEKDGAQVSISGFDYADIPKGLDNMSVRDAVRRSQAVVLPVRPIDSDYLNMPYAADRLGLTELRKIVGTRPVFSGCADVMRGYVDGTVYDYTAREEFALYNAALTAEGAAGIIISEHEGSVFGSRVLITGYGRIGRILSGYLINMGAKVTVAVRRAGSAAEASISCVKSCYYSDIELKEYDIIINTVPAPVLDHDKIDDVRSDTFIIDLASAPGGVDMCRAGERGIKCIHALALPGRTAPTTAGRIIKDTICNIICNIIKEENGGKDHTGLCDDRLLLHL